MSDILNGMKPRTINGWTLVKHPFGFAIVKDGETCGQVEVNDYPQYNAGYCAVVKMPFLAKDGWRWDINHESPLCSSVRKAVMWAIQNNPRRKIGKGTGVFAEYEAIVNPEYSW